MNNKINKNISLKEIWLNVLIKYLGTPNCLMKFISIRMRLARKFVYWCLKPNEKNCLFLTYYLRPTVKK